MPTPLGGEIINIYLCLTELTAYFYNPYQERYDAIKYLLPLSVAQVSNPSQEGTSWQQNTKSD
jgi:hypothetical protein